MTKQQEILTSLLNCGTCDLELLEDIEYDLGDIINDLKENDCLSLNCLFIEVFMKGASDLEEAFKNQKEEIKEQILNKMRIHMFDLMRYDELANDLELLDSDKLNPTRDLNYYVNYLDTHVYMKHIDFYRRYMPDVVETIETNMGWYFEQGDN